MTTPEPLYTGSPLAGGRDVLAELIRGLATDAPAVEGANEIIAINKRKREMLRDAMLEAGVKVAIDEVSGYKAFLSQNQTDTYDAKKLLALLPRPELADDIMQTVVDAKAVQELVDSGVLNRSELVREGALVRTPKTRPFVRLEPIPGVRP